jgi:hypothetical protein
MRNQIPKILSKVPTSIAGACALPAYQRSPGLEYGKNFLNKDKTCSDGCWSELCLAIPRSCANCASNESQRLRASYFQPGLRKGRELHASLMNSPRLFPPKFQLTLHHELEAHARLCNTFFRTKLKRSTVALYFRESTTDLNRPQIVRSSHDILCEDRDPFHSTAPFRRHARRGRRWRGEEVTQKGGIRDEHGFQNGQERRASI